jgi:hypothetical protein
MRRRLRKGSILDFRFRRAAAISALAFAAAGCGSADSAAAPVGGLLRSDGQFLTSPDRCVISVLHDSYRIDLPTPQRTQNPTRLFTVSGGAGRPMTLDIKGTLDGPPEIGAKLAIDIAGRRTSHDVARSADGGFAVRRPDRLGPADETPITITASVSGFVSQGENAMLSIESFDVAVGGGSPCK